MAKAAGPPQRAAQPKTAAAVPQASGFSEKRFYFSFALGHLSHNIADIHKENGKGSRAASKSCKEGSCGAAKNGKDKGSSDLRILPQLDFSV